MFSSRDLVRASVGMTQKAKIHKESGGRTEDRKAFDCSKFIRLSHLGQTGFVLGTQIPPVSGFCDQVWPQARGQQQALVAAPALNLGVMS
jgi:hypothetical protein